MRASDLDLKELLSFDKEGGVLRFGGQRAVILDVVALGLLRSELIRSLGFAGARGVLTRFGYAHGWRTAETLRHEFPWDDEGEWRRAGGRLHTLQGLVIAESPARAITSGPAPFAESVWHDSYEAEQHLLHQGKADDPVCWTLTGFASGYLSHSNGREILCIEERCRGKGDAVCTLVGRTREEWGDAALPHLPFYQHDCLEQALAHVTSELKRVERRLRSREKELARGRSEAPPGGITSKSEAMQRVIELARTVAKVDSTLLITGESGVGKERLARFVHDESPRTGGPFVAINCGAVPEGLLESELFGHVKGAFTGASQDRPGLFEAAQGGTLLLDEIGEVSPAMQVKLLRALQEHEVRRVGENKTRHVDVRVLAATNRDLPAEVRAARFRQDLYYRLRVVEIRVPPLRERREDILALARELLGRAAERARRKLSGFTPAAANQIVRHGWPGNVRELENAMERAAVLAKGTRVDVGDLPEEIAFTVASNYAATELRPLADVERDYILAVLRANQGNKNRTAEELQIGIATLYRKLKQYGNAPG
jgi:two-component system response regulator HydG